MLSDRTGSSLSRIRSSCLARPIDGAGSAVATSSARRVKRAARSATRSLKEMVVGRPRNMGSAPPETVPERAFSLRRRTGERTRKLPQRFCRRARRGGGYERPSSIGAECGRLRVEGDGDVQLAVERLLEITVTDLRVSDAAGTAL